MNLLPREIEERYGAAHGLMIPALVTTSQMEILRADSKNSAKIWHLPMLVYAGAKLVCQTNPNSGYLRPLQFDLPSTILDLEDFDAAIKEAALTDYGLEIELGHYLIMAQITFLVNSEVAGDDGGTASRTLHLFTAHVRNLDSFLAESAVTPDRQIRLAKPAELNAALEAEWNELKARQNTTPIHPKPSLLADYRDAWVFVYTRVVAQAFHQLFGWPLPQI